jgi:lipid A ethanolaminephosphotransferase
MNDEGCLAMREGLTSTKLIFAVAAFAAVFSNVAFFASVVGVYGLSLKSAPFIVSLFCFITSLFVLILSAVCHRAFVKPMLVIFLMLSSVIAYFTNTYGTIFDYRMIANILETNSAEAGDLFSMSLLLYVLLLGVLPSAVVYAVPLRHLSLKSETVSRLKLVGGVAATLACIWIVFGGHYAALVREHSDVLARVNPSYALFSAAKLAVRSARVTTNHPHVVVGPDAKIPPTDRDRELVIMVVGETARADHWSLNGYSRMTNPMLAQQDVINFPNFWACGTSTSISVPCMFSRLGRAGVESGKAKFEDNALDILSRAGVSILWRDNNSDSKGVALRVAYENFKTPQMNPVCDEECRDEGMLHGLEKYIDAQKGDILIVLHQMGNHGPAYYKRYPKAFERFTPVCKTNDLGSCTSEEINNAYDNVILYTDHFLAKVIELLKKYDDRFETAMLYVSDHGESLGEYGIYLHGMPYAIAPVAQKHVPAVVWLGQHMKPDLKLDDIGERRLRRWSHDNIFSTLLGLFEIETEAYDPSKDLFEHTTTVAVQDKLH